MTRVGDLVQNAAHARLRALVAGPDARRAAERIWQTPGPRWFTPDDPIWRVHAHASMFPGGVAALLLQSLHPRAMAGVAAHSGYRGDPWGRLQRTSNYLAVTTFGTIDHAERLITAVRTRHLAVTGADDRGQAYSASDPELLRWVHLAEAYSFVVAHRLYAADPLTPPERDLYVRQAQTASSRLGATGLPDTWGELCAQLQEFRDELRLTDAAVDASEFLLDEPPLPRPARPAYQLVARGGLACLPEWATTMLGRRSRPADRLAGRAATRSIGWIMQAERR
ncbi:oxygenase MpaB family protein [Mariniluteicoccus flavus]